MSMEFELVGLLISLDISNGPIWEVLLPMAIYKAVDLAVYNTSLMTLQSAPQT